MLTVALKGILGHKGRVVSTGIAVVLGVAFTTGALLFTDTISTSFKDLFASIYENTDVVVRGSEEIDGDFGPSERNVLDESIAQVIADVDGVVRVGFEVEHFETYIVDNDGDPIVPQAPAFGRVWEPDDSPFNPFVLQSGGRDPVTDDEIVMDKATADASGYEVGDTVPVLTPNLGRIEYTLVGVAKFGTADGTLAATQVLFRLPEAQRVLGEASKVDQIAADGEDVDDDTLADRIETALTDAGVESFEVLTGAEITAEDQDQVGSFVDILRGAMLGFAAIALLVGAFIIYNTFSILVAQRGREFALLRAIGASRRQVVLAVIVEAAVVGTVASMIGVGVGFLLAALLQALFDALGFGAPTDGFVVAPVSLIMPFVIGVVITIASATWPAVRSARIPPVAAMRDVAIDRSDQSKIRTRIGVALLVIGVAFTVGGLGGLGLGAAGFGTLLVLAGVIVAGPVIAGPVVGVIGRPFARSVTSQMAHQNARRNPARTASTALALTIGVTLVVLITILGASFKRSFAAIVEDEFLGDLILDSGSFGTSGFDPGVADAIRERPDVAGATGLRVAPATIMGFHSEFPGDTRILSEFLQAVDAVDAASLFDLGADPTALAALGDDGFAISRATEELTGWSVGTPLTISFLAGPEVAVTVETVYEGSELSNRFFVDTALFDRDLAETFDIQVFIELADGADAEAVAAAITEDLEVRYPIAEVQTKAEFADGQLSFVDGLLQLVTMLLAFSVLIAGIGITNTLSLSIFERRHELGLLRAVGMTRRQVKRVIRIESVIVALLGVALGLGLGVFFGVAIVQSASDDGFLLSLAPGQLVIIVFAGAVLGIVASWRPARRAAKLDILDAIATE